MGNWTPRYLVRGETFYDPGYFEFAAVLETMTASLLVDIERRIGDCRTLHSRIETACSLWTLSGYGLVPVHPDARDLFDARFPAVRTSIADFQAFLAGLLDRASMAPAVPQLRPQRLAETVTLSLQDIKSYTSSRDHLLDLIEALATAVYDSVVAHDPVSALPLATPELGLTHLPRRSAVYRSDVGTLEPGPL